MTHSFMCVISASPLEGSAGAPEHKKGAQYGALHQLSKVAANYIPSHRDQMNWASRQPRLASIRPISLMASHPPKAATARPMECCSDASGVSTLW